MRIEHIAIWADDIELLRDFYLKYFNLTCGDKYTNPAKKFTSYFLSFGEDKTRIELMNIPDMENPASRGNLKGLAHFAISVESRETVNELTERLRADGYTILSEPRITGDGYYESRNISTVLILRTKKRWNISFPIYVLKNGMPSKIRDVHLKRVSGCCRNNTHNIRNPYGCSKINGSVC